MTEENKQWYIEAIGKLGLPTVLLCVIIFGMWQAGKYVSGEVIGPLMKSHIEFVTESTNTLRVMQENGRQSLLKIEATTTQTAADVKQLLERGE